MNPGYPFSISIFIPDSNTSALKLPCTPFLFYTIFAEQLNAFYATQRPLRETLLRMKKCFVKYEPRRASNNNCNTVY
jgi:hypothetical protein